MQQNHSPFSDDIVCENITDEIIASYGEQGFTLVFAEEVMSYDLSLALPDVTPPPAVSYLTWDVQNTHTFFAVYQAAFRERPGFPEWGEEVWIRWTSDDLLFRPDLSFLALVQGQAVGFVTNAEDDTTAGHGYMIQVGTHPQWRGQKLGSALIVRSLQAWQEDGKKAVILHVNSNNPEALRLYQQLGFVIVKRRGKFRQRPDRP